MPRIDLLDTYYLAGLARSITPRMSFFKDRYFSDVETFRTNKVLLEFDNGDQKMVPFIDPRVGDIPVDRDGYKVLEYEPPMVAPSRLLTIDDLRKRGFGEAILSNSSEADRARAIQLRDMEQLDARIARREEWMCAEIMKSNGVTVQEYIDDTTVGRSVPIYFYDNTGSNPGVYTVSPVWTTFALMRADVIAMCNMLVARGLPVTDLILGSTAWETILQFSDLQALLDKRHMFFGDVAEDMKLPGANFVGKLDFGGYNLNVIVVSEFWVDSSNQNQPYFPAKSAMVTAPGCGKMMYGAVTQIPYGSSEFDTFEGRRIPKLIVDQAHDIRKMRLASKPLPCPKNLSPWVYAANVVS